MSKSDLIDLTLHVHIETAAAVLVSDDGEKDSGVWLPKSQIEMEKKGPYVFIITMPEWLAMDKGLI